MTTQIHVLWKIYTTMYWMYYALYDRKICTNETDFYTLEPLENINYYYFFSYKDEEGFSSSCSLCAGWGMCSMQCISFLEFQIRSEFCCCWKNIPHQQQQKLTWIKNRWTYIYRTDYDCVCKHASTLVWEGKVNNATHTHTHTHTFKRKERKMGYQLSILAFLAIICK